MQFHGGKRGSVLLIVSISALLTLLAGPTSALAQARLPAADFPVAAALSDTATWDQPSFQGAWQPHRSSTRISHRIWPRPRDQRGGALPYAEIFGCRPHVVSARFYDRDIRSITLLFLDSGTHFGYVPKEQAVQTERQHREAFHKVYSATHQAVADGLRNMSGSPSETMVLGRESMLQQEVDIFSIGNVFARFHSIEDQLVKVTLFRHSDDAKSWLAPEAREVRNRDRAVELEKNVTVLGEDRLLNEIPLFPQGDRAYCGVSALSMAMQYLGLNIDTEDYAAGAGIRYGSTRGSKIREIYSAAADELGFDIRRQTSFDFFRVRDSIDRGLPVVVWRRWNQQRDYLHTQYARRRAKDNTVNLPIADAKDRSQWPDKDAYNHASVITGYNARRGEVIFTESWGEAVRNRRMRVAEMQATCYYTFFFLP